MSPLARIPFARAEQDPTGSCVRDGERDLGNARFAADVRRLAQRLGRLGVAPGDTVAVMLPNCAEIVTTMFAAWYRGSALTPVNAALTDDEARYQLQDSAAAVLLGDERARALADQQLTQARDRFAAGVASNIEVIQAQEAVTLANEQYIAAVYGFNVSKALLARSLGTAEQAVEKYLGGSTP